MKRSFTLFFTLLLLLPVLALNAQQLTVKAGYQFPVLAEDSLLNGLKSVRNVQAHPDPLGEGVAGFAATNYFEGGTVSVFKMVGDDAFELVYTTPPPDSLGYYSTPRYIRWGDLDNDGIIEIIFQNNRNGLVIFEWDGVPGSWNFGDAPAKKIGPPELPTDFNAYTEYLGPVEDFDNDGSNEIVFSINSGNTTNVDDCYYVFSILGQYQSGNPGFSTAIREARFSKGEVPFAYWGGGTPWAAVPANLDGEGNKEFVFHNWNYGHVTTVRVTGADTYELTEDTSYVYVTEKPHDNVAYMGAFATDVDKDGRDEVYLPFFYSDRPTPGVVGMIHYEDGQSTATIDTSNTVLLDFSSIISGAIFGAGYGDYDKDGNPNLYFSGGANRLIATAEFQGGDKTDMANWTTEVIYSETDDIDRYASVAYYDSAGIVDTVVSYRDASVAYFVSKFASGNADMDKDGNEDMIVGFQAFGDSIGYTYNTWNADSGKYLVTDEYSEVNPGRRSIRMIEATATGFERKDITLITPDQYILEQNYPNPFNPTTNIKFYLPIQKKISLTIYDALGQKVKTLIDNEVMTKGNHAAQWDATNEAGVKVASGMYIYELRYGNFAKTKRMMLMK